MRPVLLGDAGVRVGVLCLGCMLLGTRVDERTSTRLLDRYPAGGAFLDASNNYAFWVLGGRGGESETRLGRWMRRRGNRKRLFVVTKVGGAPGEDLSRAAIRAAVGGLAAYRRRRPRRRPQSRASRKRMRRRASLPLRAV